MIDSESEAIRTFVSKNLHKDQSLREIALSLFYAVRDQLMYSPQTPFFEPRHYRSEYVLGLGKGYCVQKACVLCAAARHVGIPARLGFADIRNRGASKELLETLGTDIFTYHGFAELRLGDKWIKATPAFNAQIYEKHNIKPVEFDGFSDAVLPERDQEGKPYTEYLRFHGSFTEPPLEEILAGWRRTYGDERVDTWIQLLKDAYP
jgi:transglutaminase-like putative cysteine protease